MELNEFTRLNVNYQMGGSDNTDETKRNTENQSSLSTNANSGDSLKSAPVRRTRLNSLISLEDVFKRSSSHEQLLKSTGETRSSLCSEKKTRLKSEQYQHHFIDKTITGPKECKWCGKTIWVVHSISQCSQCVSLIIVRLSTIDKKKPFFVPSTIM